MQTTEEVRRREANGGNSGSQRGGGVAMVAQAHKTEGVRPRLQCLSVRASGSCSLGHLEANFLLGHDSLSPLCVSGY